MNFLVCLRFWIYALEYIDSIYNIILTHQINTPVDDYLVLRI